ncbi:toll/interleukin-1 receptor-like protein [Neltuma alba]|uniref:toll/interleukin-1 receptor-like protein n=1 Tax=Neltuma alba TaxID=207710 RepID=UPI0010A43E0D|nr:toll/interleukin-1 receptor-like protein [Prosopis alba]
MALAKPDTSAPGPSVFLSFCGKEVRNNFVDPLYSALRREDIATFRDEDDEDLAMGKLTSDQSYKATAQSQIAIVVLSEGYFSSERCLQILVTLIDSRDEQGQVIVPVFYDVYASDVRCQRGSIEAAFEKHQFRFSIDTVRRWREASTTIANLFGWHTAYT